MIPFIAIGLSPWHTVVSSDVDSTSTRQKISALNGTCKFTNHIQKTSSPVPLLNQIDQVHTPFP